MVAVKSLRVLWKNFSTYFSFSNSSLNSNNNNSDTFDSKHIKYNRLRPIDKSISSYFPIKSSTSTSSFNCLKKSSSSYEASAPTATGNKNGSRVPSYSHTTDPSSIAWNSATALDNSDTEFEDNELDDDDDSLDEYRMRTSPDDDGSDFDDEDEALTCDVCDRSFSTSKSLADHQFKKRHYGCLQCDSIFPSKEVLDEHREQMDHYDFVSDYESDTTSFESESDEEGLDSGEDEEERERLL